MKKETFKVGKIGVREMNEDTIIVPSVLPQEFRPQ